MKGQFRISTILGVVVLMLACISAFADEISKKQALVRQLYELGNFEQTARTYMDEYAREMVMSWKSTLPDLNASTELELINELSNRLTVDYLNKKPDMMALQVETYTSDELEAAIAFYRSPAGESFIRKQPELDRKMAKLAYALSAARAEQHWYESINALRKRGLRF
jgi:hypothetical protein